MLEQKIKSIIRNIPDFPKQGINFKDITPVLKDSTLCNEIANSMAEFWSKENIDIIVGIESRGFLFGFRLAGLLNLPFVLIRKPGKLPYQKISYSYELEYGTSVIELQKEDVPKNSNVLIHDDLLATAGTAIAACELIQQEGGKIAGMSFLIELDFLQGRKKLEKYSSKISSLARYE